MREKRRPTSFPDSEKKRLKREWALTSTRELPAGYLQGGEWALTSMRELPARGGSGQGASMGFKL